MQENLTINNIKWTLSTIPLIMILAAILILHDSSKGDTFLKLSETECFIFPSLESNWIDDFTTDGPTVIYNKLKNLVASPNDRQIDQEAASSPSPWQVYRNLTDVDLFSVFKGPQSKTSVTTTVHRPISLERTIGE